MGNRLCNLESLEDFPPLLKEPYQELQQNSNSNYSWLDMLDTLDSSLNGSYEDSSNKSTLNHSFQEILCGAAKMPEKDKIIHWDLDDPVVKIQKAKSDDEINSIIANPYNIIEKKIEDWIKDA